MDALVPAGYRDVIERLSHFAAQQDLVERAKEGCARWFSNESENLPYALEDVRMEFSSQALVFKSAMLGYPYMDTRLSLFAGEDDIGHYRLITLLDGTDDDDYLVLT